MEMLQKCQLSENEAKRLVQYRNGQCYKRNAEQKRLLKLGHKPTHEEEKDEWSDKNVVNNLTSISVDDRFSIEKNRAELDRHSQRTSYRNKKICSSPNLL